MKFFHNNFKLTSLFLFFLLTSINFSTVSAIISGIKVPTNVLRPGHKFTVTFFTNLHIINNAQYYVIFGLEPGTTPRSNVGEFVLTSPQSDLVEGGHSVSGFGNFTIDVRLPRNFQITGPGKKQQYVLSAAVLQTVSFCDFGLKIYPIVLFFVFKGWNSEWRRCHKLQWNRHHRQALGRGGRDDESHRCSREMMMMNDLESDSKRQRVFWLGICID
ncbi:uncharacterized protein EI90DRAFT_2203668 [Cantharellus anzutake]|uniref:uncharacterized protein n=1 Tax=Cantharellus anzutake TaxID=1750568 RepID=UPI0019032299|nr:uncharacterized protein EI90DRAFT_2203668 [Cantharellus anzutake]KAF8324988.1 hypothetical protein EI90DRAFT_2203668 [Cantharellus anzutake]